MAEDGESYFVHVRSEVTQDVSGGGGGGSSFTVVYMEGVTPPPSSVEDTSDNVVPENDRCVEATRLEPGVPVNGDNSHANFDFVNQGACGLLSDRPGVWYEVVGSMGKEVTLSVCTNNNIIAQFGVFDQCNGNNANACHGFSPQTTEPQNCEEGEAVDYSWIAEDGESYYVHVRSNWSQDNGGAQFTIVYDYAEEIVAPSESPSASVSSAPTALPTQEDVTSSRTLAPTAESSTSGDQTAAGATGADSGAESFVNTCPLLIMMLVPIVILFTSNH
jgi:hypothetical protein